MIKIQHIDIYHLKIPLASSYRLSKLYGTLHNVDIIFVQLTTDDGLIAYAETNPMNPFSVEDAKILIGKNVVDVFRQRP